MLHIGGGINASESIPGLFKGLQIRALVLVEKGKILRIWSRLPMLNDYSILFLTSSGLQLQYEFDLNLTSVFFFTPEEKSRWEFTCTDLRFCLPRLKGE
jgi:hypothetical protein